MINPFGLGLELIRSLESSPVTIRRGLSSYEVPAVVGSLTRGVEGVDEVGTRERYLPFMFGVADLKTAGFPFPFVEGDEIDRTVNGNAETYEVASRDGADPWQWSDPGQTEVRVFTSFLSGDYTEGAADVG